MYLCNKRIVTEYLTILFLEVFKMFFNSGDIDKSNAIVAETSKLTGNAVYGHTIMRKDRHTNVKFVGRQKASKLVNDPLFMSIEEFDKETFEVSYQANTKLNLRL